MKIGFFQFDPVFGKIRENVDYIVNKIDKAPTDLLVLPELCTTGYQFSDRSEVESLAENISHSYAKNAFELINPG